MVSTDLDIFLKRKELSRNGHIFNVLSSCDYCICFVFLEFHLLKILSFSD